MGSANTFQGRFRWRDDDGSESAATWKAAVNINWTPVLGDMDIPHRLRNEISNDGGMSESAGQYTLFLDVDGGGYNVITTTSTDGVQLVASAYVSDNANTTEQLAGAQTHQDGKFDSNGVMSDLTLGGSNDMEMEYCFKLVSADLGVGGQVLSFRTYREGSALDGYTNTGSITVPTLPVPEWTQAEFRIRAGGPLVGDHQNLNVNGAGDWAYAANTSGDMPNAPDHQGTCFGLRFKVSAAVASGSKTLKIQAAKNGGAYSDLAKDFHNDQSLLTAGVPVGLVPTIHYTDGAATTQVLSGSSFVAGTGEHDGTAAAVTLGVGDHTEYEWRVYINKTWEACGVGNVDGDYYDFRLVESDGTVLEAYTNTPRITLDYDDDYVGGCYPESIGDYGIYFASDGDAFTWVEESELTGDVLAMRRASGTTLWTVVDSGNEPSSFSDLEAFHAQQIGDTMHLFTQAGGGTHYVTFNMSAHTWGTAEEVHTQAGATNQQVFGARRSDGTTVCFMADGVDSIMWKERSSGGVWDVSPTTFSSPDNFGMAGVLAYDDKVYIVYQKDDTTIYARSFDKTNAYGTERSISTDPVVSGLGQWSLIAPVYWDDAGTEKVGVIYQEDTDKKLYWRIISNDGAPGTASVVIDNAVLDNATGLNSRQPAANAAVDAANDMIYVVYSDATDTNVYYTVSDNGGTFNTDTEIQDGVDVHGLAVTFDSSILHILTEEPHVDDTAPEGRAGFTGGISVIEYALSSDDDLTATGITANPTLDTPTIGQEHDLTATGTTTNPVVDTPTAAHIHDLSATGITADPVVDTPTAAHIHDLTATEITADPVVETPTVQEIHNLDATEITADPVVETPTITEIINLTATEITADPVVDTPTVQEIHNLDATEITADPVLDTPAVQEIHNLTATEITADPVVDNPTLAVEGEDVLDATGITADPVLDTPTLGQEHLLSATGILANSVVETPTAAHIHDLSATGITADPVVDNPTATHIHDLTATGITADPVVDQPTVAEEGEDALTATGITADPVLDTPTFAQVHALAGAEVTADPVLDTPTLATVGEDALDANDITADPVVDNPTLGQEHALDATAVTAGPVLDTPALTESGEDNLTATGITTNPVVEQPAIGQAHVFTATGIVTNPEVETAAIGQIHTLDAAGIETNPVVDTPAVSHIHVLSATGITTNPVVDVPSIAQVHALDAATILASPLVGVPSMGQTHILGANGIITTPALGTPMWDLIEGVVVLTFTTIYPEADITTIKPEITFSIPLED